jgi:cell division initiation protein
MTDQVKLEEPTPGDTRRLPTPDRSMTISPLDLRQAKFGTSLRGFDRTEVMAMLLEAADAYEQSLRENERLRHELVRFEAALLQHRELEGTLKSALLNAQRVSDEMRENATLEAARIVREAEGQAAIIVEKTEARLEHVQREIDALRLKRREVERNVTGMVASLTNTLEFIREQDEREHRIIPHRPRLEAAG